MRFTIYHLSETTYKVAKTLADDTGMTLDNFICTAIYNECRRVADERGLGNRLFQEICEKAN